MTCRQCMRGDHNLCPNAEGTIVGPHGGFADRVRATSLGHAAAGAARPGDRPGRCSAAASRCSTRSSSSTSGRPTASGVVGIGGLGHMAVQFPNKWGCEVIAFSSGRRSATRRRSSAPHHVVNSRTTGQLQKIAGSLDFILVTVNVALDWPAYIAAPRPGPAALRGRGRRRSRFFR